VIPALIVVTTTSEVDVDGECGDMDGQVVSAAPDNRYMLAIKVLSNWMDSKADDGIYNWDCIGTKEGDCDSLHGLTLEK
jgi:hypothetical protein